MAKKLSEKKRINFKILSLSIIAVFAVSLFGSLFTADTVRSSWYQENKPSITPPNWIFGPVWTLLYILIAISFYIALTTRNKELKRKFIWLFTINLLANAIWSLLFFGLRNPLISFIDLTIMWLSAAVIITLAWKTERKISYMILPYLLWITFAGILNFLFIL